jgi:small subunit ribosomal protein S4e
VEIEKAKENFRLLYDTKGHIVLYRVVKKEAAYKLCLVKKVLCLAGFQDVMEIEKTK